VERHHVGARQEFVQAEALPGSVGPVLFGHALLEGRERDPHAEDAGSSGHGAPYPAEANDAERLPRRSDPA
jgi:hypothetical protein